MLNGFYDFLITVKIREWNGSCGSEGKADQMDFGD